MYLIVRLVVGYRGKKFKCGTCFAIFFSAQLHHSRRVYTVFFSKFDVHAYCVIEARVAPGAKALVAVLQHFYTFYTAQRKISRIIRYYCRAETWQSRPAIFFDVTAVSLVSLVHFFHVLYLRYYFAKWNNTRFVGKREFLRKNFDNLSQICIVQTARYCNELFYSANCSRNDPRSGGSAPERWVSQSFNKKKKITLKIKRMRIKRTIRSAWVEESKVVSTATRQRLNCNHAISTSYPARRTVSRAGSSCILCGNIFRA